MKKIILPFVIVLLYSQTYAQQKEFEGILHYKNDLKSKINGINVQALKNAIMFEDSIKVVIKNGNYHRSSRIKEEIYLTTRQKVFIRFKGIDTLYYLDYSSDTSSVSDVELSKEIKKIQGFDCNSIAYKVENTKKQFFYAPALYINPEHDQNNKIGRYDVYAKNAHSVWLQTSTETEAYLQTQVCTNLSQTVIDDKMFTLPSLPEKRFNIEDFLTAPEFSRSSGWMRYIQTSVNPEVAGKYLKIPRGQNTAIQTAIVLFMINESGKVLFAQVINKNEVHPKLVEEALRVIQSSPNWKPAMLFGQKIIYWYKQPVTFQVAK